MNITKLEDNTMVIVSKSDLVEAIQSIISNGTTGTAEAKSAQNDNFISIDEVANITGYKRPTLYRFVALKQIPHYKRKGRICFKSVEVNDWMNEGKCEV